MALCTLVPYQGQPEIRGASRSWANSQKTSSNLHKLEVLLDDVLNDVDDTKRVRERSEQSASSSSKAVNNRWAGAQSVSDR